jgi:hypothetical protein
MVASSQYVENMVATFDRAADANRRMPGRQGSTILLTPELADEVMITGDIHGQRRAFNRIRQIAALDKHPRRHLVFQEVCHGGSCYPNGGCKSHAILEDVAELVATHFPQVHLVLGNHELAELADFPIRKNNQLLNLMFRLGLRHSYGLAEETIRQAISRFLWTCPLAVRLPGRGCGETGTGASPDAVLAGAARIGSEPVSVSSQPQGVLIAHSLPQFVDSRGFDPAVLLRDLVPDDGNEDCDVFRLVWGRDYRPENARAFCELVGAKVLITGHEPCREGFAVPNDLQVILDCCGHKAAYAILPVGADLSHAEVVQRIEMLEK